MLVHPHDFSEHFLREIELPMNEISLTQNKIYLLSNNHIRAEKKSNTHKLVLMLQWKFKECKLHFFLINLPTTSTMFIHYMMIMISAGLATHSMLRLILNTFY